MCKATEAGYVLRVYTTRDIHACPIATTIDRLAPLRPFRPGIGDHFATMHAPSVSCDQSPADPAAIRTDGFRQSSDVRADLTDRVLRYEVTETFINRGSGLGEADYMFPLPKGAAFQDLKLSINGEMVAGETMNARTGTCDLRADRAAAT